MGSSTGRRATFTPKQIQVVSTIYLDLPVDANDIICNVCNADETEFLLDVLENFESDNVNAALREYFKDEDKYKRVTGVPSCVSYFEEELTLLNLIERFDPYNVNAALREYFRFQSRDKLPDFVDANKL